MICAHYFFLVAFPSTTMEASAATKKCPDAFAQDAAIRIPSIATQLNLARVEFEASELGLGHLQAIAHISDALMGDRRLDLDSHLRSYLMSKLVVDHQRNVDRDVDDHMANMIQLVRKHRMVLMSSSV